MKRSILINSLAVLVCLAGFLSAQEETRKGQSLHHKQLEPLQGLLGEWKLTGEVVLAGQPKIPFVFHRHIGWTLGNNFIETSMTEMVDGKKEIRHKSIIGWETESNSITEWGFWNTNLPTDTQVLTETVTWSRDGENWVIEKDKVRGVYTIIDQDTHKYECQFGGDDGSANSWHFTAKRKKK